MAGIELGSARLARRDARGETAFLHFAAD